MLEAAKRYREMGYSVIPLRPGGKEPLIKWSEFTQRYASDTELSTWFGSDENNVGIVTGKLSGLAVVDADGEQGLSSIQKLSLASPMIAQTGKGQQLFYKFPIGVDLKNSVRLLPGLDIRTEGGYVAAPPSIHPNGKRYSWLVGPSLTLPDFPLSLLATASLKKQVESRRPEGWEAEILAGLKEGNRDDSFTRLVGKFHHIGLDRSTIWALLLPHARRVDFADSQLNKVIQSVCRYSTDPAGSGQDAQPSSIEQFLADFTPVDWLCEPIIAKGAIGFIAGLPETCKTWLTIDLAVEVARGGGLWLGLYPVSGGRVLFVDQERAKGETQRRFKAVLSEKKIDPKALKDSLFIRSGTTTRLDVDESYNSFRRAVSEIRPALIVVDSFATFHVGNENNRMEIQRMLERVKELRAEFGCSIIFIDHENKLAFSDGRDGVNPTAFRMVGSVGKIAAAEIILTVRRIDPVTCAVFHTKATLGPRIPGFAVHVINTPEGGIRVYGEAGPTPKA